MVTLDDLYEEAKRFLWNNFGLTLTVPIEIDEEMASEEGAYEHTEKEPYAILIADFVMKIADDDVIYDVLRHELVHYALHCLGKPFHDGHPFFEATLAHYGVKSSGSTMIGVYHLYECAKCGEEIPHYRKVTEEEEKTLATICCTAKFIDKKRKAVYTGRERIY